MGELNGFSLGLFMEGLLGLLYKEFLSNGFTKGICFHIFWTSWEECCGLFFRDRYENKYIENNENCEIGGDFNRIVIIKFAKFWFFVFSIKNAFFEQPQTQTESCT